MAVSGEPDKERDEIELYVWREVGPMSHAMKIGICRGSQFLNVLNGGRLWQDVNNHGRTHPVLDHDTKKLRMVSSTHHQQFRPAPNAVVVATAQQATQKLAHKDSWCKPNGPRDKSENATDYEVLWYSQTRSLCFQGHPEYAEPHDCQPYFMDLIRRYF